MCVEKIKVFIEECLNFKEIFSNNVPNWVYEDYTETIEIKKKN